ncbi:polysaccharide deacetylase family protein [Halalkalicoccus sp. NIPERK01]|uniref:polysaccharide deacetylase family protein n=1 Tax=Halalkalicoccus sp. NIPERK01 TaxID=3053469 RepID=UPI00256F31CB|nr:polysaccharide deacetylase family protein [Halalkalicoccus sp. NIPERK01]MDL5360601.1 polysaccharide deacetylase family protein [Halalkalicoccus sp. NIPERK01]
MSRNRRTFLATVAALGVAGCTATLPDQIGSDDDGPDEADDGAPPSDADEGSDGELLFDFRDIHEWDLAAGNLSPDREAAVTGEVSARLDGERDPVLRIDRTGLDLDLTDRRLSIVGRVHSPEPSQAVDVIVTDVDGNRMRFRTRFFKTDPETEFMPLDLGIYEWDDTAPDLAAIDTLRIQTRFDENAGGTLWVDSVYLEPMPETPKLMIQWDDGFETQYTNGLPILTEYDIPATTFVNTANLGDGRLTVEQLTEMQEAGWEVGSHLMTHANLRDLSEQEQEAQIRGAKEWLIDNGFEEGAEFFAYTYGSYDRTGYALVEEYHTYAMVGGDPGYGLPRNPIHVGRASHRSLEAAREYVDTLVQWGGVGALFWHEIPAETTLPEFEGIMQYITDRREAGELDVITLSDLAALQGR